MTEWLFSAAPPEATAGLPQFRTPRFTRTLSQWLNLLVDTGFRLERLAEPRPSDKVSGSVPPCKMPRWFRISCTCGQGSRPEEVDMGMIGLIVMLVFRRGPRPRSRRLRRHEGRRGAARRRRQALLVPAGHVHDGQPAAASRSGGRARTRSR